MMAELLPRDAETSEILYLGFRAAFVTLVDQMLGDALEAQADTRSGVQFLDRFELLQSMAPQVQLESLLTVWDSINGHSEYTLLSECVCLAALELLADLSRRDDQQLLKMAWAGPQPTRLPVDHWICSHVRVLQIALIPCHRAWQLRMIPATGNDVCRAVLQMTDPEVAERDRLLALTGRWRVSPSIQGAGIGLITEAERDLLRAFFEEHPALLGEVETADGL